VVWSLLGSAAFFCLAPGVAAGVVPWLLTGWRVGPPLFGVDAFRVLGVVLIAAAGLGLLDCFSRFALEGRGTPAPVAPATTLVVSGQYRHVRNPMYLCVVGVILGQGLLFGSEWVLGYGIAVWCGFHVFVVAYEEPALGSQFGEAYATYRANVRRWWPAVRPWDPAQATAEREPSIGGAPNGE
jgi:protein-S-isoprenylcysteine O-methyltransferase Ste14